ncbi:hypothetical protein SAMN02746068_00503 [Lactococcus chungangensis CAU 28 = DSM 22330]|uniref:Uncharacterized protein n=1 Tax=Pseudolactococcus chungangensis CAU 28 = DSM 22330 TaxID=1122154 RepID=A0A1K2H798_9LACT|nr:hypothetical protein SAMN02746068_00503 [Lactococcus chungangensis CAU 28 = DSM 22330]
MISSNKKSNYAPKSTKKRKKVQKYIKNNEKRCEKYTFFDKNW